MYLSDMTETGSSVGHGVLGKNGSLGYGDPGAKITVNGWSPRKGLSMHGARRSSSFASYRLDGKYAWFTAGCAVADNAKSESPLTFLVLGDGQVLWQSKPVRTTSDVQSCTVNVQGVKELTVRVACPGEQVAACSVWLDPYVAQSKTEPKPPDATAPVASADELYCFKGDFTAPAYTTFTKDGKRLMTEGNSKDRTQIIVWDIESKEVSHTYSCPKGLRVAGFSQDGRITLLRGSDIKKAESSLTTVDLETGKETGRHTYPSKNTKTPSFISFARLLPDGQRAFVSWSRTPTAKLIVITSGQELVSYKHPGEASIVYTAVSPDGTIGITLSRATPASRVDIFTIWDIGSGKEIRTITLDNDARSGCRLAILPDGKRFASVYSDGRCIFWSIATGMEVARFGLEGRPIAFSISPDGTKLLYSESTVIHVIDVESAKEIQRLEGHSKTVSALQVSPDGQYAASGASDGTVRLWRLRK